MTSLAPLYYDVTNPYYDVTNFVSNHLYYDVLL